MTLEAPLYQQALTVPARQDRAFIAAVFDTEGVLSPSAGALLVAQRAAGTNMSVDVAAGSCVVAGDDEANQGSYFCKSTAVENVVIGAAPGSNSRIDLIVARVRDATVTGVSSDWILEVVPGTVAASPVVPSTPNTAIPLAKVTVATGTTAITNAMVTDLRTAAGSTRYLGTAGGTMTGELVVPDLKVTGLTGSVTASRYVGANTGAPTTGAHLVGDWIIDPTGKVWICTVAGTPGTWVQVGGATTKISESVLGSAAASITFSSIPATYRTLMVHFAGRGDLAANEVVSLFARLNGDTAANYDRGGVMYNNATQFIRNDQAVAQFDMQSIPAATAPANDPGIAELIIPNYAGTTFFKGMHCRTGTLYNATAWQVAWLVGQWRNTAAVNSITLLPASGNFLAGTTATLYGLS